MSYLMAGESVTNQQSQFNQATPAQNQHNISSSWLQAERYTRTVKVATAVILVILLSILVILSLLSERDIILLPRRNKMQANNVWLYVIVRNIPKPKEKQHVYNGYISSINLEAVHLVTNHRFSLGEEVIIQLDPSEFNLQSLNIRSIVKTVLPVMHNHTLDAHQHAGKKIELAFKSLTSHQERDLTRLIGNLKRFPAINIGENHPVAIKHRSNV